MRSAVDLVDLYCLAEGAGSVVLLWPADEVELVDPQHLVEEAERLGFQCSTEEVGLAGFTMAAKNWISPCCLPARVLD
jgi:hypothetical protein